MQNRNYPELDIPNFLELSKKSNWNPKLYQPMVYNEKVIKRSQEIVPGTIAYDDFWDEMDYYCINGFQPKGMPRITGKHFFYLNFCRIDLLPKGARRKVLKNPFYRDLDHWMFLELEAAQKYGYGLIIGKPRRVGLSEFGVSAVHHELKFFARSKAAIAAGKADKSQEFYEKLKSSLDNVHPAYKSGILVKNSEELKLGYNDRINKQNYDLGLLSFAKVKTMFADESAFEGGQYSIAIFEEAGLFEKLLESYKATEPCFKEGAIQYGIPLIYGCVCAGTKVWDNEGNLVNIEDIRQDQGIIGYKDGNFNKEPIIWMKPPAKKECVRITTNSGTVLECSEDHPILYSKKTCKKSKRVNGKKINWKTTKWKDAGDLIPGDQVSMIDKVDIWSEKEMWEPRLVGMLIGDGSYGFDKTPVLSSCDKEINDYIYNKFDCVLEKEDLTKDNKIYKETRIRQICSNLREIGIYGQTKKDKRLPDNIHSYSKNTCRELIAGLFDTDGHVSKININLTSISREMLVEVKLLLQKMGIHSTINEIEKSSKSTFKSKENYYKLHVLENVSIIRFYEEIDLLVNYKKEALEVLYNRVKNKINKRSKTCPGIKFEKVISIERIGLKEIYNLNAGDSHTYVANGIITHNTGGDMEGGSKGYKKLKEQAVIHNLKPILIKANMYFPGDGIPDEKTGKTISFFNYETGVSNRQAALEYIEKEKKIAELSRETFIKHIQTYPMSWEDVFMRNKGGLLDLPKLNYQNSLIDRGKAPEPVVRGKLVWEDTEEVKYLLSRAKNRKERTKIRVNNEVKIKFVQDDEGNMWKDSVPINHKYENSAYKPDIGGCDSYDEEADEANNISSGSIMAYRMFINPLYEYDKAVGVLVDRGEGGYDEDKFYEAAVMFAIYWDIEVLVEYSKIMIIRYFYDVGAGKHIRERPMIEEINSHNHKNKDGLKMTELTKKYGTKQLRYEVAHNIHKCFFKVIIEDLMKYGIENTDITMSYMMCLYHKLDLFPEVSEDIEIDYSTSYNSNKEDQIYSYYIDVHGNLKVKDHYMDQEVDTFIPERDLSKEEYLAYKKEREDKENNILNLHKENNKNRSSLDQQIFNMIVKEQKKNN